MSHFERRRMYDYYEMYTRCLLKRTTTTEKVAALRAKLRSKGARKGMKLAIRDYNKLAVKPM